MHEFDTLYTLETQNNKKTRRILGFMINYDELKNNLL